MECYNVKLKKRKRRKGERNEQVETGPQSNIYYTRRSDESPIDAIRVGTPRDVRFDMT